MPIRRATAGIRLVMAPDPPNLCPRQSLKKYDKAFKESGAPQLKGEYFDGLKVRSLLFSAQGDRGGCWDGCWARMNSFVVCR